jgi:ankyrin repeat protein
MRIVSFALPLMLLAGCGHDPSSPLTAAARAGHLQEVASLIAHGADPNAQDDWGNHWTPLLHAVHKHQLGSVAALIDGGADPNGCDPDGTTPLMMAAGYGHTDMVELLLRRGANPRITDRYGVTAIDLALTGVPDIDRFTLFDCQNETAKVLLRAGSPAPAARTWARLKGC